MLRVPSGADVRIPDPTSDKGAHRMLPNRKRHRVHVPVMGLALTATVAAATILAAAPAQAQSAPRDGGSSGWSAMIGAGAAVLPEYPGGEDFDVSPVPLIDLRYRVGTAGLDTVFLSSRDGLGVVVLDTGRFSIGGAVNYAPGRDQDDADRLSGLGDIDAGARGMVFVRADFGALGLALEADRAFGGQEGTTVTLAASYDIRLSASLTITPQIEATLADKDSMREWFGVTPAQAARSGLAAYEPDGGFRSADIGVTATYALTPRWNVISKLGITQLLGDAADSPIVEEETQPYAFVGVTYRF